VAKKRKKRQTVFKISGDAHHNTIENIDTDLDQFIDASEANWHDNTIRNIKHHPAREPEPKKRRNRSRIFVPELPWKKKRT
jgi:hypothetical protein